MTTPEPLADLLLDLAHDLGKYIRMPLAFLPKDAPNPQVHAALQKALLGTRPGQTARQVWDQFLRQAGPLPSQPPFVRMQAAVDRALQWEQLAQAEGGQVPRSQVEADLDAVGPAVRAALRAVQEDGANP